MSALRASLTGLSTDEVWHTARRLLHTLWTDAVGTKDYDKSKWLQLEQALEELSRRSSK